jgi:hypothetical protein
VWYYIAREKIQKFKKVGTQKCVEIKKNIFQKLKKTFGPADSFFKKVSGFGDSKNFKKWVFECSNLQQKILKIYSKQFQKS